MTLSEASSWIVTHGLVLIVGGLILLALYPRRHVAGSAVRHGPAPGSAGGALRRRARGELQKRASTLQDVLVKLIRAAFLLGIVLLVLGVFDLFGALAGLGLVAAALTLAGQAIVLDYLMGILILIEGPYFQGDWIAINGAGVNVEGQVEEITLRRTTLRDGLGQLHSVSNGLIRVSSNTTRVYSLATVEVQVLRPADLDRAIAVAGRVARELGAERGWDPPTGRGPVHDVGGRADARRRDVAGPAAGTDGRGRRCDERAAATAHGRAHGGVSGHRAVGHAAARGRGSRGPGRGGRPGERRWPGQGARAGRRRGRSARRQPRTRTSRPTRGHSNAGTRRTGCPRRRPGRN